MNPQELASKYVKSPEVIKNKGAGLYKHLMYCPFTGLGLYNGFRGNRWLKNRIKVFKEFVIPSLQAQTEKNFTLWISWRPEERHNRHTKELQEWLRGTGLDVIHTFSGICFYDDKYPDQIARERLATAVHGAMSELINATEGEEGYEWVLMTIQPSDDCYHKNAVKGIQDVFRKDANLQAFGFESGYIMNYQTKEIAEWNPKTNPPFYTIKFFRPDFINPLAHIQHTALKHDSGPYKKGTPLPSHEYVKDCLRYGLSKERGFLVGVHSSNISTVFDHPYRGNYIASDILKDFGLDRVEKLTVSRSINTMIFNRFPYSWKRKLRYLAGEYRGILRPFFSIIYNILRS